ncbi:putative olfactory receptor 13C6 [Pelobates fuscus]|uniref:putative olfactory receptor 13C6 n=1 Tax=Pelobates fuscus TaxID=191477 RepID=UPI002FE49DA0
MNRSTVTEFILLGLSSDPSIQVILFIIFLAAYMASLAANGLLILAVSFDHHLHNPMYFFLINLSIINIGGPSAIVPKMLLNFVLEENSISYSGCTAQIFFNLLLGSSEYILLLFMAYDRFVAICKPMRYHMVMSTSACTWMITVTWTNYRFNNENPVRTIQSFFHLHFTPDRCNNVLWNNHCYVFEIKGFC